MLPEPTAIYADFSAKPENPGTKTAAKTPWVEACSSQPWTGEAVRERLLEAVRVHRGDPLMPERDSVVVYLAAGAVNDDDDAPPLRGAARENEVALVHRRILRDARSTVCHRPGAFAEWADKMEHIALSDRFDAAAETRADEAISWIVRPLADADAEKSRMVTLRWLTSRGPKRESHIRRTCDRIAKQLGEVDAQPFTAPRKSNSDLVYGVENIALELGFTVVETKRKLFRGELPIGVYFGMICAHRALLSPFRERHSDRRVDRALAA